MPFGKTKDPNETYKGAPIGDVLDPTKTRKVKLVLSIFATTLAYSAIFRCGNHVLSVEGSASGKHGLTVKLCAFCCTHSEEGSAVNDIGRVAAKVCLMLKRCGYSVNRRQTCLKP